MSVVGNFWLLGGGEGTDDYVEGERLHMEVVHMEYLGRRGRWDTVRGIARS